MRTLLAAGLLLASLGVAACEDAETETDAQSDVDAGGDDYQEELSASATCDQLRPAMLRSIAEGLIVKADLLEGQAVELPADEADFGYNYVAAVKVRSGGAEDVVILGLGSLKDGPITTADNLSKVYFDWGAAATEDSPMGVYQESLFLSDAAGDAEDCIS